MAEFSFGQVEAVLARFHRIDWGKRAAFTSRLKHLQKQGLPDREQQPGRGRAGTYSFNQLMQLAVGIEFIQAGMPPLMAKHIVTRNWRNMIHAIFSGTLTDPERAEHYPDAPDEDLYWVFQPEALADLSEGGVLSSDFDEAVQPLHLSQLPEYIKKPSLLLINGAYHRHLLINATSVTKGILRILSDVAPSFTVRELQVDLLKEREADLELRKKALGIIENGPSSDMSMETAIDIINSVHPARWGKESLGARKAFLDRLTPHQREVILDYKVLGNISPEDEAELNSVGLVTKNDKIRDNYFLILLRAKLRAEEKQEQADDGDS